MPSPAPELGEGSRDWPWGQALIRLYAHLVSSCLLDDIECSFEVVGDGGEVDLDGDFGETALSHPAKPVALFPGAEHLFDSALHPMDRLVHSLSFWNVVCSSRPHIPVATIRVIPPFVRHERHYGSG